MDKILKKISYEGDCWVWTGCRNTDGYPKLGRKREDGSYNFNVKGHRYVYEQTKGPIPTGMVIRHKCDNILCLNPEHLEIGTPTDNNRDRVERGRTYKHVSRDLWPRIKELRQAGLSQQEVANIIGCTQTHISKIENGKYVL